MAGDAVWLEVLPDLSGFGSKLGAGADKAAGAAGKSAGGRFSKLFALAAGDVTVKDQTSKLEKAAKDSERAVEAATAGIAKARASQRTENAKTIEAEKRLADRVAKYGEGSAEAAAASERLEAARERQREATRKAETAEAQLVAAHDDAKQAAKDLADATEESAGKGEKAGGVWAGLKGKFGASGTGAKNLGTKLGALAGTALVSMGVAKELGAAWEVAWDKAGAVSEVSAALGLTEDQAKAAGDAASNLWRKGYGADIGEATKAVGAVQSSIQGMKDASAADLEDATARAQGFAKVFDVDVSEAARNAGILIANGLAPDATSAFDLMTKSLQQVPESLRGEVMDATQEYSQYFAQLGFDGADAMAMIGQAAATDGQYGIDKMGDAVKEFSIRAIDGSKTTQGAMDIIGLSASEMATDIATGGDSAQGAMDKIVNGLLSIKDPAQQSQAAIALFGTPLEDLGQDELPTFLEALVGGADAMEVAAGTSDVLKSAIEDNVDPIDALKRSFMSVTSDALEPFAEPATEISNWAQENPGVMKAVVIALGTLAVALGIASVAMWVMNSALLASPLTWIIVGIVAVIAAIVLLATNWDTVTAALGAAWDWLVAGVQKGFDAILGFFTGIGDKAAELKDAAVGKLTDLRDGAVERFTSLRDGATEKMSQAKDWVGEKLDGLKQAGLDRFQSLKDGALDRLRGLRDSARDIAGNMTDLMGKAWDLMPDKWKKPVIDILNFLNTHLIDKANSFASNIGLGDSWLPRIPVPKLATGGRVPGSSPSDTADNVPILATADEYMVRRPSVRRLDREHPGALDWINRYGELPQHLATGGRVLPVSGPESASYPGHSGIDYAVPTGTRVRSSSAGVVDYVGTGRGYGRAVFIVNADGTESVYGHLLAGKVSAGQHVGAGQYIADSDNTGRSTGPHLHLETTPDGVFDRASNRAYTRSWLGGATSGGSLVDFGQMLLDKLGDIAGGARNAVAGAGKFGQMLAAIPGKLAAGAVDAIRKRALSFIDSGVETVKSGGNYALASAMALGRGWSPANIGALLWLIQKESGGRVDATNPTSGAYGIPQALPGSKMASSGSDWRTNPRTQIDWMLGYIVDRYGSAVNARDWHIAHNWYDTGGVLPKGLTLAMNGTGKDEAILTSQQWDVAAAAIRSVAGAATGTFRPEVHQHIQVTPPREAFRDVEAFMQLMAGLEARAEMI